MGLKPFAMKAGIKTTVSVAIFLVAAPLSTLAIGSEASGGMATTGPLRIHLPLIINNGSSTKTPDSTITPQPTVGTSAPTSTPTATPTATAKPGITIAAAGDIAAGGSPSYQTADLVESLSGPVLTLGDNAYPDGSAMDFQKNFEPTWGRFKSRIYPSPGNHDYDDNGYSGYFDYFGARAGEAYKGWYSFEVGDWHLISLNSNCWNSAAPVSCAAGSEQETWLREDLAAHPRLCSLAYWHAPLFNSGATNPSATYMMAIWQDLYAAGVDVVLNGHAHSYERFAPQDPDGNLDTEKGILEIVAGTGGNTLSGFLPDPAPNSLVRDDQNYGILQLVLFADRYTYQFTSVPGGTDFSDSGSERCH
jgi:acid phosphatase type 7